MYLPTSPLYDMRGDTSHTEPLPVLHLPPNSDLSIVESLRERERVSE